LEPENSQVLKVELFEKAAIDYVIIHELCHTKEHNHADRFWRLVEAAYPTYKQQERYLKEVSTSLELDAMYTQID